MISRIKAGLDNRANPIMIKEMYQAVHSRLFMNAFLVLPLAALLIYTIAYPLRSNEPPGAVMFTLFTVLISVMALFMIPMQAFFNLYNQVSSRTLELVQITGINPHRLVRGCLAASGVKVLLVFTVIAPFTVASYLFGGVDLFHVVLQVLFLLALSLCLCALSLAFGSLAVYPKIRTLTRWGYPAGMFFVLLWLTGFSFYWLFPLAVMGRSWRVGFDPASTFAYIMGAGLLATLFILFMSSVAANALTFPHDRSSMRVKVLALMIVAALGIVLVAPSLFYSAGSNDGEMMSFQIASCLFLGTCGLLWITADRHIPHRHLDAIDKAGPMRLRLYAVFSDGTVPTMVYLLLGAVLIVILVLAFGLTEKWNSHAWSSREQKAACYPVPFMITSVIYLSALTHAFTRLLPRTWRTLTARRVILFCLVAVMLLAAIMYRTFVFKWPEPGFFTAFLPPMYLSGLDDFDGPPVLVFVGHMTVPFLIGFISYAANWRSFMPPWPAAAPRKRGRGKP